MIDFFIVNNFYQQF